MGRRKKIEADSPPDDGDGGLNLNESAGGTGIDAPIPDPFSSPLPTENWPDPFSPEKKSAAPQEADDQDDEGDDEPDENDVPSPPGHERPVDEGILTRKWMIDYPDDALVTVKLWEIVNGVSAQAIGVWHDVLLSKAREPESWIEYGGDWMIHIIHPDSKKVVARKRVRTRGEPAPKWWRPRLGSEDMDPKTLAEAAAWMQRMGMAQVSPTPNGVPQFVWNDQNSASRQELSDAKSEINRLRDKLEVAQKEASESKNAQNILQMRVDTRMEEIQRLNSVLVEYKNEIARLREKASSGENGGGKPQWAYFMEAMNNNSLKPADLIALISKTQGGGTAEAIATLNSAMEIVQKAQGPKGNVMEGLSAWAPVAKEALGLVTNRQKMVSDAIALNRERESRASQQQQQTQSDPVADTMDRLMNAIKNKEDPEKVGFAMATSVDWVLALGLKGTNQMASGFIDNVMKDPEGTIQWVCEQQGADKDYSTKVASGFRKKVVALGGKLPELPVAKPEAAVPAAKGNGQDGLGAPTGQGNGSEHGAPVNDAAKPTESVKSGDSQNVPAKPTDNPAPGNVQPVG